MDAKPIGKQIWKYRNLNNMSREQLAERVGLTPATLRQYENGHKPPRLETLIKIANVLNVSVDELLCNKLNVTRSVVLEGIAKKMEALSPEQITATNEILDVILKNSDVLQSREDD